MFKINHGMLHTESEKLLYNISEQLGLILKHLNNEGNINLYEKENNATIEPHKVISDKAISKPINNKPKGRR